MSDKELIARYRNLLIAIARQKQSLDNESVVLRSRVAQVDSPGKKAGLACLARCLAKQSAILGTVLRRNHQALQLFFKTSKSERVALEEIKLHSDGAP